MALSETNQKIRDALAKWITFLNRRIEDLQVDGDGTAKELEGLQEALKYGLGIVENDE